MLMAIAILTLLLTPLAMLVVRLVRPRFGYQWLVAVIGALLAWSMILLAKPSQPYWVQLIRWQLESVSPTPLALWIDQFSWPYAFILSSLCLAVLLTAVARFGQVADWRSWAASLSLGSLGILAVLAGNLLTLMIFWAALDLVETLILLSQSDDRFIRERVVTTFSMRIATYTVLILGGISVWSSGTVMQMDVLPIQSSLWLLLAAGLRLGMPPFHEFIYQELPKRRGLGGMLRLTSAAAGLALLTRVAATGILNQYIPALFALAAFSAFYSAVNWFTPRAEASTDKFWVLGGASLALASSVLAQPYSSLAWGAACLLAGGLFFLGWPRHRNITLLLSVGVVGFTALPLTVAWNGTGLYLAPFIAPLSSMLILTILLTLVFLLSHAMLLYGYLRRALAVDSVVEVDRWVWLVYPAGLALLALVTLLMGLWLRPDFNELPLIAWLGGLIASGIAGILWYWTHREASTQEVFAGSSFLVALGRIFSFNWLKRGVQSLYHIIARALSFVNSVLEGEGGVLWAILILVCLFAISQM